MKRKYYGDIVVAIIILIMLSSATAVPLTYSNTLKSQRNDIIVLQEKSSSNQTINSSTTNNDICVKYYHIRDISKQVEIYTLEEDNITRLLFNLSGLLILLLWIKLLKTENVGFRAILFADLLHSQWQLTGHKHGYLPTDCIEPPISEEMALMINVIGACLVYYIYYVFRNSRAATLLTFLGHLWMELEYAWGYLGDD